MEVLNRSHFFNGHQITIDRMLKKLEPRRRPLGDLFSTELFVGGIPNDVTHEEIEKLFQRYGSLKRLIVPSDKNRNRGYAFVRYENCESVNAVFADLPNIKIRAKEVG